MSVGGVDKLNIAGRVAYIAGASSGLGSQFAWGGRGGVVVVAVHRKYMLAAWAHPVPGRLYLKIFTRGLRC